MDKLAAFEDLLVSIAMPLLVVDNASLHVVLVTPTRVHLHLGGAYAGCPGNEFIERSLLAPLTREVFPSASLEVTSGLPIPAGAKALAAKEG